MWVLLQVASLGSIIRVCYTLAAYLVGILRGALPLRPSFPAIVGDVTVAVASAILFLVRHPSPGVVLSGLFVAPSPSSGLIAFLVVVVVVERVLRWRGLALRPPPLRSWPSVSSVLWCRARSVHGRVCEGLRRLTEKKRVELEWN